MERKLLRALLVIFWLACAPAALAESEPFSKRNLGKLSFDMYRVAMAGERGERLAARGRPYVNPAKQTVSAVIVLAPGADPNQVAGAVRAAGGSIQAAAAGLMEVSLPPKALRQVASHPGVLRVRAPYYPTPKEVTSEGVNTIHAGDFIARTGATGSGVTVAILDASFARAEQLIGSELPEGTAGTDFVLDRKDEFEDVHGTACAEIVHDVAPGASLILAGFGGDVSWAQAVDELVAIGVDIISHSIGFDNIFPPDGNNFFAQKVDEVMAAGVLFVTAAGNEAESYFQGAWRDGNGNGYLEFNNQTEFLPIFSAPPGGSRVVLRWDDAYGASSHDYDLYVVTEAFLSNPDLSQDNPAIVARSEDLQDGAGDPLELIDFEAEEVRALYVVVRHDPNSPLNPGQKFFIYSSDGIGGGFTTPAGTLSSPGDARGAVTVGAVRHDSLEVESFSSRGPTADGRVKPDVAGPDQVATASYAPDPFPGTSAATPHVAGAAALLLSRNLAMSAAELRQAVEQATNSLDRRGKNNDTGFGLIDLNRAR